MRRFIRFMSSTELLRFMGGEELVNDIKHDGRIKGSFGFCFFDADDIDPITAHHVLCGIATMDYMVEFYVEDNAAKRILTKSKGAYLLPGDSLPNGTVLTEYCTESYSKKDFTIFQVWELLLKYPAIREAEQAE